MATAEMNQTQKTPPGHGKLVLSRFRGDSFVIGEGANAVRVTVLRLLGARAQLLIEAPKSMPIVRSELLHD